MAARASLFQLGAASGARLHDLPGLDRADLLRLKAPADVVDAVLGLAVVVLRAIAHVGWRRRHVLLDGPLQLLLVRLGRLEGLAAAPMRQRQLGSAADVVLRALGPALVR